VRIGVSVDYALAACSQQQFYTAMTGHSSDVSRVDGLRIFQLKDGVLFGMNSLTSIQALPGRKAYTATRMALRTMWASRGHAIITDG
jgi:hypothetical protein